MISTKSHLTLGVLVRSAECFSIKNGDDDLDDNNGPRDMSWFDGPDGHQVLS